jgi:transcription termination factor Rho
MSTTEVSRATLESKDKEELTQIAAAMGRKPSSRARKGEIVELILELAGVGSDESEANADTDSGSGDEGSAAADSDDSEDEDEDEDEEDDDEDDDEGDEDNEDQGAAEAGSGKGPARRSGYTADPMADARAEANGGSQQRGGGDQGESSSRKRRRRGRNRESVEEWAGEPVVVEGHLDLRDDGYGFLRVDGSLPSKEDVYVPVKMVRQFGLRRGDHVIGASRPAARSEKNPALVRIDAVNGHDPEKARQRPEFEALTPLFPDERLRLERPDNPINMTTRIIDLVAPIGKGQRGLIVSPPKAGKTTIMKEIARSIEVNNPEVKLIVLLVDERPEEVTDMKRWLKKGEVVASTFDRPSEEHIAVAELTIERAKRMVETGNDVVVILDGITRLARAYNLSAPGTGRVMSGGVDAAALYPPKRFFGSARNVEEGGSLTILATALVETGSRMDEVIFEEFKGTGNMELRLDRHAAERRLYPAIDVDASSTRHEELLFDKKSLDQVWKLRRVLQGMKDESGSPMAGLELLIERLGQFKDNQLFLAEVAATTR